MARRTFFATLVLSVVLTAAPAWAGGGGCGDVTRGTGTTVELSAFCVTPTLLRVAPGTTVTFVNRDPFEHVIAGAGYHWGSDGDMREGEAFSVPFDRPGVYPFQCYYHPGMSGAVIVGDGLGHGAAEIGGIFVEPAEPEREVIVSPSPVVRTLVRTVERASAWPWAVAGVAGVVLGGVGGSVSARRRGRAG